MSFARVVLGLPVAGAYLAAFGPPRRWAQARGSAWGRRTPVEFHRLLCRILNVKLRRLGAPSAEGPRLIVANHVSWLDIPVLGSMEPMSFLAKSEVGRPWLGRQLAGLQGIVYVDRLRKRGIPKTNAAIAAAMRSNEPVVLFAEATTSDGMRILKFRSSHFEAARAADSPARPAVVQPVYMHFHRLGGLIASRRDLPAIAWYGDMFFLPHLFGVIEAGGVGCDVIYGAPIPVAEFSDRKALARAAEVAVRGLAKAAKAG